MTPILCFAFVVWLSLSCALLADATSRSNWHAVAGWIVAIIFICLFFIVEITQ
jgi:hypothetical protein